MKTTNTAWLAVGLLLCSGWTFADSKWNFHGGGMRATYQAETMIKLPINPDVGLEPAGAATLLRTRNGLQGRVMVNVETIGDPYTVWWVIWNHPQACVYTPCGTSPDGSLFLDDFLNPATKVSIFNASGAISASGGDHGVVNVDVSTVGGVYPEDLYVLDLGGTGNRLHRGNGFGAEVHLVVDIHTVFASWVEDLTTTSVGATNFNHRAAVFLPKRPTKRHK